MIGLEIHLHRQVIEYAILKFITGGLKRFPIIQRESDVLRLIVKVQRKKSKSLGVVGAPSKVVALLVTGIDDRHHDGKTQPLKADKITRRIVKRPQQTQKLGIQFWVRG